MFADFARSVDLRADFWEPLAIGLAVVLALVLLVRARGPVRWRTQLLMVLAVAALIALTAYLTNNVWHPVAEGIDTPTWFWSGYALWVAIYAVILTAAGWAGRGRLRRALSVTAATLTVVLGLILTGLGLNAYYGGYPTLASALGITVPTSSLSQTGTSTPVTAYDTGGRPPPIWRAREPSSAKIYRPMILPLHRGTPISTCPRPTSVPRVRCCPSSSSWPGSPVLLLTGSTSAGCRAYSTPTPRTTPG